MEAVNQKEVTIALDNYERRPSVWILLQGEHMLAVETLQAHLKCRVDGDTSERKPTNGGRETDTRQRKRLQKDQLRRAALLRCVTC